MKYTTEKSMKCKDKVKLQIYVEHLRRIQKVDKTWNFSATAIAAALRSVNQAFFSVETFCL